MCTQQTMTITGDDGKEVTVNSGYVDCMQSTCPNSVRFNPPPQPDND